MFIEAGLQKAVLILVEVMDGYFVVGEVSSDDAGSLPFINISGECDKFASRTFYFPCS